MAFRVKDKSDPFLKEMVFTSAGIISGRVTCKSRIVIFLLAQGMDLKEKIFSENERKLYFRAKKNIKILKINIKHLNKDLSETRNWDWISKYQEDEKAF
jgi:hypothetical protein